MQMIYYFTLMPGFAACYQWLPCFWVFSSFPSSLGLVYLLTFYGLIFIFLFFTYFRWIIAIERDNKYEVFTPKYIHFSRAMFNFWNWTNKKLMYS